MILLQRCVFQRVSPSPNGDRAQQQPFERGAEGDIATLNRIPRIAQQMRQAHLPVRPVAALAAQHVGDPDRRLDGAEQVPHHSLAAAGANDVQHRQRADEHPFPPGLAGHPCRGLVGTYYPAGRHGLADRRRRRKQRLARAGQHVADRTFTDRQGEHLAHQGGQPFQPDGLGVMQVHHQRRDRLAER
jgi:hypothetical protein